MCQRGGVSSKPTPMKGYNFAKFKPVSVSGLWCHFIYTVLVVKKQTLPATV